MRRRWGKTRRRSRSKKNANINRDSSHQIYAKQGSLIVRGKIIGN
jgi:hypothetical protein